MIVDALLSKSCCQGSLLLAVLLDLGSLVLEPDLQLVLAQTQLRTEILPSFLCQVSVSSELLSQPLQLVRSKGRPWSLVIRNTGAWAGGRG